MSRVFSITIFALLFCFSAFGQQAPSTGLADNKLGMLLKEREQLTQEYKYYNSQNSNFWGKKSKKDLLQIIQSLKQIINKDSEIIREIHKQSLQKQAITRIESGKIKQEVIGDQMLTLKNLHQLKQEVASLHNLQKVKDRQLNQLKEELEQARQSRQSNHMMLALAILLCLALLFYVWKLRRRLHLGAKNT